jgi:hypothetical protein
MATKFLTNIDLNQNQLVNATFEVVGTDPTTGNFEGRLIYNSTEDTIKVYSGSAWRKMLHSVTSSGTYASYLGVSESNGAITLTISGTSDATATSIVARDASGNIKVATPTDAAHAATKGYVDAARQGLDVKQSVRVATTAPIALATELEVGDVLDTDVTLVAGDRVLVKDQATASQNGIYVVQPTGAPLRATDANGTADTGEISGGTFTFVEEGHVNADSGWVVSSNGTLTVGTDPIAWVQFSGAGSITAGDGLSKDGNILNVGGTTDRITVNADTVDIASTYVGQNTITTLGTITTGTWNGVDIAVADGGTGASTESSARTNLAAGGTQGFGVSVPVLSRTVSYTLTGSATSYAIQHGLGSRDVVVQVYTVAAPYETVYTDVERTDTNNVTVKFASAAADSTYRVVITG